jgi:hypothetical protein
MAKTKRSFIKGMIEGINDTLNDIGSLKTRLEIKRDEVRQRIKDEKENKDKQ